MVSYPIGDKYGIGGQIIGQVSSTYVIYLWVQEQLYPLLHKDSW
jgi:hypothetical protein